MTPVKAADVPLHHQFFVRRLVQTHTPDLVKILVRLLELDLPETDSRAILSAIVAGDRRVAAPIRRLAAVLALECDAWNASRTEIGWL